VDQSMAYRLAHRAGELLHSGLARRPGLAEHWFSALSLLRHAPPSAYKQRIVNSVAAVDWPKVTIRPQRVVLGSSTEVVIRPHPGEFDFQALLDDRLDYERSLFQWLEQQLGEYDAVVEIGANVGVFTVFMAQLKRARGWTKPRVVSFEPSRSAFARLLDNLALNGCDSEVFNCAVSDRGGVAELYEPQGHLTNGSLDAGFAGLFSSEVRASRVLTIGSDEIAAIVPDAGRTLLKIDVEGAEPLVLRGLKPWIERVKPDVLVEVLPGFDQTLRDQDYFAALGYRFMRIEERGPIDVAPYEASGHHRDHFLAAPPASPR
jgi:FkbM family methyltransferase